MKGMESEAGGGRMQYEMDRLKRSVQISQYAILALGVLVLALLIALAAVGASQNHKIQSLRNEVTAPPNVTLSSNSGDRNTAGLTYGGSLFRGSGFWASRASLPVMFGKLTDHLAVGVGESVYIFGGADVNGTVLSQVLKYDPVLHTYTPMTSMPGPRYRFGLTLLDNGNSDTVYIVGGRVDSKENLTSLTKSVYIYNINNNSWTVGPVESPVFQSDTCAGSLSGKVYQIGGYDENYNYLNKTYVYDPATTVWTQLADMPTARGDLMCVNFLGEVYVLGGYYNDVANPNDKNSFSNKMESFNPATGAWTTRPNLLTPRGDAGVTVVPGNKIMLVGGEGHYINNDTYKYPKHVNEVYYADDQTWVQKAFIPTARFRTAAATAGGLTYVIGGADVCPDISVCPALDTNEVYLDLDHPRVYLYLKNDAYNDTFQTTTYPL